MSVVGDGIEAREEGPPEGGPPGGPAASPKAQSVRDALIDAAYAVFSRDGFLDARIGDIAAAAGVAHGTFYTYFTSKEAIFRELAVGLAAKIASEQSPVGEHDDPLQQIESGNRAYLRSYQKHAALIATMEQVATFNDDVLRLRREIRRPFTERNAAAIHRWQRAGIASADLDPVYAATALGAMVERFMYLWFVLGEDFEEGPAIETLTRIWASALGLRSSSV